MMKQAFSATKLSITRGHKHVLKQISLALQAGEVLSLLGANGAGKSSFLSALAGELNLKSIGKNTAIELNKSNLFSLNPSQQAQMRAILPQSQSLTFNLTVQEVIAMGAYPYPELSPDKIKKLLEQAIRYADIYLLKDRLFTELSGGEQQRVQYARVILQILCGFESTSNNQYMLLDEPTSSLDPKYQHGLLRTAKDLAKTKHLGVLVILHDVNLASIYSDKVALLAQGQLLVCDCPQKALTTKNLQLTYEMQSKILPHPMDSSRPLVIFY